jgi:release factor glutamine methyltransferase
MNLSMPSFVRSKLSNSPLSQQQASTTRPASIGLILSQVRAVLYEYGGVSDEEEGRAESEILLKHLLVFGTTELFASLRLPFPPEQRDDLLNALARRIRHEPMRYITGTCPFYGREFNVDARVLIPRPETEQLIDQALAWADETHPETLRVADIGTGSGAIAVTLARELPLPEVHAVDISPDALQVATANAIRLAGPVSVVFYEGDLTEPLEGQFDILTANLPYVQFQTLEDAAPELAHEPRGALDGGITGMDVIDRLIPMLSSVMNPRNSLVLLEIDPPLAAPTISLIETHLPEASVAIMSDFAGLARVAEIRIGG